MKQYVLLSFLLVNAAEAIPITKISHAEVAPRILQGAEYGTHMAPLAAVIFQTEGPVLEMGCGDFSTPILHALCSKNKRLLVSADTDKKWLSYFADLVTNWHELWYVSVYTDDWECNKKAHIWDQIGNECHWSVVFIDHRPGERRVVDIQRLRNNTDIFVVHDTEQPTYGYEPTLSSFRYRYIYKRYKTCTTIVSDVIDVSQFFEN